MQKLLSILVLTLMLACAADCAAQFPEKGYWRAASNTAASITGDITLSNSKITIDFASFLFAPARQLTPAEVGAVFDEAVDTAGPGSLFRLNIPATRRFLSHNTLCGSEDTHWMATYVAGKTLRVAFFSGDDVPTLTFEELQKSTALCGTYTFVR
jgi:hypothetical protein